MTPRDKDQQYLDLQRHSKAQDIHMDIHNALRHARWQVARLEDPQRATALVIIDDALSQHWRQMMRLQQVIGRLIKEVYDAK